MEASTSDPRSVKPRKSATPLPASAGHSIPTTFFIKTEKELERPRRDIEESLISEDLSDDIPEPNGLGDSSFGVQSLAETINSTFSSDSNLSRTTSSSSQAASEVADHEDLAENLPLSRQRRTGKNRVSQRILATGQRILSAEHIPTLQTSFGAPPALPSASPLRHPAIRRGSGTSLTNMSQPSTPIKFGLQNLDVATPSTPRSASCTSFVLSDEEGSVVDDTVTQAIMSSSGDEEDEEEEKGQHCEATPQLVMPSLAMPARRPFTEQGRQIGKTKIMVIGPKGVGKTSFITSLFRSSEHIVHIDQSLHAALENKPTTTFIDIQASTRPYPPWWTDFESKRSRRNSISNGVLERNLTFIDTPGIETDDDVQSILNYTRVNLRRTTNMESMSDGELVGLLSGNGGNQIDAVIYLFNPALSQGPNQMYLDLSPLHQELLQNMCSWTNFIPLIGRADTVQPEQLHIRKQQISQMMNVIKAEPYRLTGDGHNRQLIEPLAISSAAGDDAEVIDASVLMSSQYLQPLVPSEIGNVVEILFRPTNISRMRHLSAVKFLEWRRTAQGRHVDLHQQTLLESPFLRSSSPGVISNGSLLEDPSKVLVPHSTSSYYRSTSSGVSDISTPSDHNALATYTEQQQRSEPFRRVRLAKWASDLQRSLDNERRKYQQMYINCPSGLSPEDDKKHDQALVSMNDGTRPSRGRLGGDLGVIDPRDPLGVLAFGQAFGRKGFIALQILGGCGLLGAVAYWVMRNWIEVQEFLGLQQTGMVSATAVPAPNTRAVSAWQPWLDDTLLRSLFGWVR